MTNAFGGRAAKEAAKAQEEATRLERERMERETTRMKEEHALNTANAQEKVAKVVGQDTFDTEAEGATEVVPKKKKKPSELMGFK